MIIYIFTSTLSPFHTHSPHDSSPHRPRNSPLRTSSKSPVSSPAGPCLGRKGDVQNVSYNFHRILDVSYFFMIFTLIYIRCSMQFYYVLLNLFFGTEVAVLNHLNCIYKQWLTMGTKPIKQWCSRLKCHREWFCGWWFQSTPSKHLFFSIGH